MHPVRIGGSIKTLSPFTHPAAGQFSNARHRAANFGVDMVIVADLSSLTNLTIITWEPALDRTPFVTSRRLQLEDSIARRCDSRSCEVRLTPGARLIRVRQMLRHAGIHGTSGASMSAPRAGFITAEARRCPGRDDAIPPR
jgi:hypothetical protein